MDPESAGDPLGSSEPLRRSQAKPLLDAPPQEGQGGPSEGDEGSAPPLQQSAEDILDDAKRLEELWRWHDFVTPGKLGHYTPFAIRSMASERQPPSWITPDLLGDYIQRIKDQRRAAKAFAVEEARARREARIAALKAEATAEREALAARIGERKELRRLDRKRKREEEAGAQRAEGVPGPKRPRSSIAEEEEETRVKVRSESKEEAEREEGGGPPVEEVALGEGVKSLVKKAEEEAEAARKAEEAAAVEAAKKAGEEAEAARKAEVAREKSGVAGRAEAEATAAPQKVEKGAEERAKAEADRLAAEKAEAARKADEEAEAAKKAEEAEAARKAEQEAAAAAAAEAARVAEQEAAAAKAASEAAKKAAEEEAARKVAEEAARVAAEEEAAAAKKAEEEEAARKAAEEEAARKAAEEAARKAAEEEAARKAAEEAKAAAAARKAAEEEAARKAAEEAKAAAAARVAAEEEEATRKAKADASAEALETLKRALRKERYYDMRSTAMEELIESLNSDDNDVFKQMLTPEIAARNRVSWFGRLKGVPRNTRASSQELVDASLKEYASLAEVSKDTQDTTNAIELHKRFLSAATKHLTPNAGKNFTEQNNIMALWAFLSNDSLDKDAEAFLNWYEERSKTGQITDDLKPGVQSYLRLIRLAGWYKNIPDISKDTSTAIQVASHAGVAAAPLTSAAGAPPEALTTLAGSPSSSVSMVEAPPSSTPGRVSKRKPSKKTKKKSD